MNSAAAVEVVSSAVGIRFLVMREPWNGAMEAVVSGNLAVIDGFLGLRGDGDDPGRVLLLAAGTTIVYEDPFTIETLGRRIRLGDVVYGGGGEVDSTHPWLAGLPPNVPVQLSALQTLDDPPPDRPVWDRLTDLAWWLNKQVPRRQENGLTDRLVDRLRHAVGRRWP